MSKCICGSEDLIEIGTQNIKKCLQCGYENRWFLDKDQVSKLGDTSEAIQRDYIKPSEETSP